MRHGYGPVLRYDQAARLPGGMRFAAIGRYPHDEVIPREKARAGMQPSANL